MIFMTSLVAKRFAQADQVIVVRSQVASEGKVGFVQEGFFSYLVDTTNQLLSPTNPIVRNVVLGIFDIPNENGPGIQQTFRRCV